MFYLYGDISGKPTDKAMVGACYAAPERCWLAAEKDWRVALREAKVTHFHATDFFNCRGEFRDWKRDSKRHVRTGLRFAAITASHWLVGVAVTLDGAAYERVMQPAIGRISAPHKPVSSRAFVTQACVAHTTRDVLREANLPDHERVAIVFEDEKGMGQCVDYFNYCKKRRERWTQGFLSFALGPKTLIPLQMADLLAYEVYKMAVARANGADPQKTPTFEKMLAGSGIEVKEMQEKHIRESLPKIEAFVHEHPDGLLNARRTPRM